MRLENKVAVISGGARGMGAVEARMFAQEGAKVVIADLKLDAAQKAADELTAQGPGEAMAVEMNVTDETQVNDGVAKVVETWGKIDVLVSNAGVQIVHPLEDFPFDDWKKLLSIHLDGAFLTSKAVMPHMQKAGSGSIIFMGSVHSKEASPLKSAYVTAKHGIAGFTKTIALEPARYDGVHELAATLQAGGRTEDAMKVVMDYMASYGEAPEAVTDQQVLLNALEKSAARATTLGNSTDAGTNDGGEAETGGS